MSACERWVHASLPLEATVLVHATREAQRRAAELRLDEATFVERLRADRDEVERLLRVVVPPETWLFRHAAAFDLVRAWLQSHPGLKVRMLSLGCARGAEPFSLAATAASVGRTEADTEIVGMDWCEENLREAERGSCSPLAQRGPMPEWATPWFAADARGWLQLEGSARRMLRWVHGDIVRDPLPGTAQIVMCRNAAIYLGEPARQELARRLAAVTDPAGLLFVGHADPTTLWEGAFFGSEEPASFGHRRRAVLERPVTPPVPLRAPPRKVTRVTPPAVKTATIVSSTPVVPPATRRDLALAQQLADEGRLTESADMLLGLLDSEPLSVDTWSILGAVRLAQHRPVDAESCFRKVVYLQPNHSLSLLQLSALAESRGDHAAADRLRLRAARAATGEHE